MKRFFTFLCIAAALATNLWGTEVQVGSGNSTTSVSPLVSGNKYAICQQMYTKNELNGLSTSDAITAIAFNYAATGKGGTQKIEIYFTLDSYDNFGSYHDAVPATDLVFSGNVTLPDVPGWYKITLDTKTFKWDGKSKALLVTVLNKSTSKLDGIAHYCYTSSGRQCYSTPAWPAPSTPINGNSVTATKTNNVPQIKFYFGAEPQGPAAPSNVKSSNVTYNGATISWDAVDGADSYSLQYKKSDTEAYTTINNIAATSYSLSDLEPSTQYIYGVKTVKGTESSGFTADANFTTLAEPAHTHNDITFTKWTSTDALPNAAGNYYLANNVTCNSTATISNAINLCLNGKTIDMGSNNIQVTGSLAIYDCEGTGVITSSNNDQWGGTIKADNGTVSLYGGKIINTSKEANAFCVYNNGTLQLGGTTSFSSEKANICLHTSSRKITILSGFAPSEPISVGGLNGTDAFTTGWSSVMGSKATIADYFTPANSNQSFAVIDGELKLAQLVTLDENATNNNLTNNPKCNVQLMRTFSNASYSTICLPFALSKTKIETAFGIGTKVQALTNSSLSDNGTELTLDFYEVDSMEATKPYIIKPANTTANPTFQEVTISGNAAATIGETDYVKMVGFYNQTFVAAGQKEVLVLSADNELKWLSNDGYVKGTRAYFRISYPAGAAAPARMHMSLGNSTPTSINPLQQASSCVKKQLINGQLLIIRDGKAYNAQGQKIND